jgi:hypothetical protein
MRETSTCPEWTHLIFLSRQLSEVIFFRHENSGQWKEEFSGIFNNQCGVEYSVWKLPKFGAEPEQPGVSAHDTFS